MEDFEWVGQEAAFLDGDVAFPLICVKFIFLGRIRLGCIWARADIEGYL